MTILAASAAICAFLGYFLRRTAKPEDALKKRAASVLSGLALVIAAIYLIFRVTSSI
jgi:membrane protein DedA with SNARE-associated domain